MNYRSVMLFRPGRDVRGDEKRRAADAFMEHAVPGRLGEMRPPCPQEMNATIVIALPIHEASAKVRRDPGVTHPPQNICNVSNLPAKVRNFGGGAASERSHQPVTRPSPRAVSLAYSHAGASSLRRGSMQGRT